MGSVNKVFLVGRLGKDPELRYTAAGKAVCTFSVATDRWVGRDEEPVADWHHIVAWERQAETCSKFLSKGRQVAVAGRVQYDTYTDKEGVKKHWTEIRASEVTFLGSKSDGMIGESFGQRGDRGAVAAGDAARSMAPGAPASVVVGPTAGRGGNDDLPF